MLMNAAATAIYGSSFFAATAELPPPRAPLVHDLDVDVCVIGAGLAGLTTAREVARRGWSVAVLEGQRIAWNASGRNTGFVLPGFGQDPASIVERVGMKRARALWALSQVGVDYVRATINEPGMAGIEPSDGWLFVSKTGDAGEIAAEGDLLRELGADIEIWPTDLLRSKLKTPRYFDAIYFPTAFNIHPLNYALGLARLAEQAGARIFEETPALSIDPAGVRKRVVTANGRVRAAHIVLAGNVHLGRLMPEIARTLLPIRTYVMATQPLGDKLAEAFDYGGSVTDTDWADNHYRIVRDRLIWSGRMTTWQADPWRFARRLRRDIRRVYPQLGDVEIEHAWTGTLGNAVHRMPQIGEVSHGVWIVSGFGGHGINTTAMGGNLVARAIVEGDTGWRLFLPFELIWAGGILGRAVAQSNYWIRRRQEKLLGFLARRRELKERRAAEAEVRRLAEEAQQEAERLRAEEGGEIRSEMPTDEVAAEHPRTRKRRKKKAAI